MSDQTKQKISDFLVSHTDISLATVDEQGKPWVAIVAYVSDGNTLYIVT